jgi:hypothetical protein
MSSFDRLEYPSLAWGHGVAVRRNKAIGIKAAYPGFIEPALASFAHKVPDGTRWIHEIKFDGYRVQVHLQNGQVKVFTRRSNDWTKRFRKIASDASEIDAGLCHHRRRGGRAIGKWRHRFRGAAERAEGQIHQNRARRLRPALSERT